MGNESVDVMVPRRTLLMVAGASGVLVACGGSDDGGSDGGDTSGPAPGTVLATTMDVPVGGGFVNKEAHVVITQTLPGEYRGFTSICPHKGCDVGTVTDNVISCPCHESKFSAETGDVQQGPASAPLAPVGVFLEGDTIVSA